MGHTGLGATNKVVVRRFRADIERKVQQILHSTFGYVQDDNDAEVTLRWHRDESDALAVRTAGASAVVAAIAAAAVISASGAAASAS